jgi:hypothetical protein
MNRSQFNILFVVLLLLVVASVIVYKHGVSTWNAAPAATGKVLGDFQINDVAKVVIQTGAATLTLEKKNGTWVVPARDNYPADFARIGDFIQSLWQLKPGEDIQAGPSQLGRLELLPPGKGEGTGMLIDLQNKDSKSVAALLVGKKFLKQSPQSPDPAGYPAGRYVMPAGSNPPKVSLVSDTLEQADPSPAAWLDKTFLHFDRVRSIALDSGTNQWSVSRGSDVTTDWKLAGIKPGETLDQGKIMPFGSTLSGLTFNDVMPASAKPEGIATTLTLTTFDQVTYTLKFGKPGGENLPMSITVAAPELPRERTADKNESPDVKKRLDDDFAANQKRLAGELAAAKKLESRIYLVQKTMFDYIFVPRSDLLAPPPPSPSSSPAAPALPPGVTPAAAPLPSGIPVSPAAPAAGSPAPSPSASPAPAK